MTAPWLSQAVVENNTLKVQTRLNPGSTPGWYSFHLLKRAPGNSNSWISGRQPTAIPRDIIVSSTTSTQYNGYLLLGFNTSQVTYSHISLTQGSQGWVARVNRQGTYGLQAFGAEIYRLERVGGLRLVQRLSVAVALMTGFTMSAGFGPLAGAFGVGATMSTTTTFIVSALSSAVATFIHGNFQAMTTAVRHDPEHGAARYFQANTTSFGAILSDTFISGAAGGVTSLIPAPSGANSFRDIARTILNRAANNIANQIQTVVQHYVRIQTTGVAVPSVQSIRDELQTNALLDIAMRCFG